MGQIALLTHWMQDDYTVQLNLKTCIYWISPLTRMKKDLDGGGMCNIFKICFDI